MSKDSVKLMFEKISKDGTLQKQYAEMMAAHGREADNALAGKLIELGKSCNFNFSKNDLAAARAELLDMKNSSPELSDDDLEKVAGGGSMSKGVAVFVSIGGLGVACGFYSAIWESQKQGYCGYMLSTANCDYPSK